MEGHALSWPTVYLRMFEGQAPSWPCFQYWRTRRSASLHNTIRLRPPVALRGSVPVLPCRRQAQPLASARGVLL